MRGFTQTTPSNNFLKLIVAPLELCVLLLGRGICRIYENDGWTGQKHDTTTATLSCTQVVVLLFD